MIEIVKEELSKVYPGARASHVQETFLDRAITEVSAGIDSKAGFVDVWTDLFMIFSDDRAFDVTRSIFTRLGIKIPDRYRNN